MAKTTKKKIVKKSKVKTSKKTSKSKKTKMTEKQLDKLLDATEKKAKAALKEYEKVSKKILGNDKSKEVSPAMYCMTYSLNGITVLSGIGIFLYFLLSGTYGCLTSMLLGTVGALAVGVFLAIVVAALAAMDIMDASEIQKVLA